jgi:hypothetical protein
MDSPLDQSTQMTDYYPAQGEREVRPFQLLKFSGSDINSKFLGHLYALLLLSFFVHFILSAFNPLAII